MSYPSLPGDGLTSRVQTEREHLIKLESRMNGHFMLLRT